MILIIIAIQMDAEVDVLAFLIIKPYRLDTVRHHLFPYFTNNYTFIQASQPTQTLQYVLPSLGDQVKPTRQ